MKPWHILVGFSVVVLTMGVLVGIGRAPLESLGVPVAAFLGWMVPTPKQIKGGTP